MHVVQEKISLAADRRELAGLRDLVRGLCDSYGVRSSTTRRVVLAVDEAVANVLEHSTLVPDGSVEITIEIGEQAIVVEIADEGGPFDPSTCRKTEIENARGQRRGFGLYLIHLVTDRVEYSRTNDGKNKLTLTIDSR